MANYVGGDKLVLNKMQITAAANLVDKTFVTIGGAVPANAANAAFGVVERDTANGDYATVKFGAGSVLEVVATGTVTAGGYVQGLLGSFTTKDSTAVPGLGVNDIGSGYVIGKAITGGSANDTVLVELISMQVKPV
jgi:hypothetical protein